MLLRGCRKFIRDALFNALLFILSSMINLSSSSTSSGAYSMKVDSVSLKGESGSWDRGLPYL